MSIGMMVAMREADRAAEERRKWRESPEGQAYYAKLREIAAQRDAYMASVFPEDGFEIVASDKDTYKGFGGLVRYHDISLVKAYNRVIREESGFPDSVIDIAWAFPQRGKIHGDHIREAMNDPNPSLASWVDSTVKLWDWESAGGIGVDGKTSVRWRIAVKRS